MRLHPEPQRLLTAPRVCSTFTSIPTRAPTFALARHLACTLAAFLVPLLALLLVPTPAFAQDILPLSQIYPPVTVKNENGLTRIRFPLLRHRDYRVDGTTRGLALTFGGEWNGRKVAAFAILLTDWEEQRSEEPPATLWWSDAQLQNDSTLGDALVRELASLYGQPAPRARMASTIDLRVLASPNRPGAIGEPLKLRAFIEGATPAQDVEFFLNIDLSGRFVEIAEKDAAYRQGIVRALVEPQAAGAGGNRR